jgi:hypothetical protein
VATDRGLAIGLVLIAAALGIVTQISQQQSWAWLLVILLLVLGLASVGWTPLRRRLKAHRHRKLEAGRPQIIRPAPLKVPVSIGTPTVIQGPKPGWEATCAYVGSTYSFGRGVVLSVHNNLGETFPTFRCLVRGPNGYKASGVSRLLDSSGNGREEDSRHFPGEFEPKPASDPPPTGTYQVEWFADTGDPSDERELFLARTTFTVTDSGEYFCARNTAHNRSGPAGSPPTQTSIAGQAKRPGPLRLNETGQALAGNYPPRLYRAELNRDMSGTPLIVRTVLGCPIPMSEGDASLDSATKRSLLQAIAESPLEGWLRIQSQFCQAEDIEPWRPLGRYNDSQQSTLWWNARPSHSQTVALRARCQVMVGTTVPFLTALLDVVADVGGRAAESSCGQMALERLVMLLRACLKTGVESIGETVFSVIARPNWRPHGPAWFLDGGTTPLQQGLNLSRFSQASTAEPRTEYGRPAHAGVDLWSEDGQRSVIRRWMERLLLDLQYEDLEDELDDLVPPP